MFYISKYSEVLNIINLIMIFCIPISCFGIYLVKKKDDMIYISLMYIFEIITSNFIFNNENAVYFLFALFITKLFLFSSSYIKYIFIVATSILSIKSYIFIFLSNILLNLYSIKIIILDNIRNIQKEYLNNREKFKENNFKKENLKNELSDRIKKQAEYNEKILDMNRNIEKMIKESKLPIFVLDIDLSYISSNSCFEEFLFNCSANVKNFDIEKFLKYNFREYKTIEKNLMNLGSDIESMDIESYDDKVYKLTYTLEKIEDKDVIICILDNITNTISVQNKLFESEQKYKKLIDVLSEGIIISNKNKVDYFNEKALEILDINEEQVKDFIKNSVSSKFISNINKEINLLENKIKDKIFIKVKTKSEKFVEMIVVNMTLNNEQYLLTILSDVTDFENTISQIKEREKTYKLLLQTLPEGIVILDKKNNNQIYKNEASNKVLDSIGVSNLNDAIKKYIYEGEYGIFKNFIIDKANDLEIALAIIDREEENHYIVVFRTLDTEHKIKRIKEELKEIEIDSKFKTNLMISIAEDIKEPIDKISKCNLLISDKEDNSEHIKNYNKLVNQNIYRLKRLINNIKEIENNNTQLNYSKCNIYDLVKNIVSISSSYIKKKELDINFKTDFTKEYTYVDVEKLEKIILNIISNSIKFTEKGHIDIKLKSSEENIHIFIKDTGFGIPEDKIDMIFMSFNQVDRTLSRTSEGTGIGLAVAKKLADIQNIKINVSSEENKWSEFEIVIPKNMGNVYESKDFIFADDEKVAIEFSDIYLNA